MVHVIDNYEDNITTFHFFSSLDGCSYGNEYLKKLFFEHMFKTSLSEAEFAELKTLANLAPGDFRTVRQACFYLAEEQTNASRIEALKAECALKRDGRKGPKIGF